MNFRWVLTLTVWSLTDLCFVPSESLTAVVNQRSKRFAGSDSRDWNETIREQRSQTEHNTAYDANTWSRKDVFALTQASCCRCCRMGHVEARDLELIRK